MQLRHLLILALLVHQPADAVQFACQNRDGNASADNVAVVRNEDFMGEPRTVIHFPPTAEGRDFIYSELLLGTPGSSHAVVEPRAYKMTYGSNKDWSAIYVEKRGDVVPLMLTLYYGANPQCQTTVRVQL